MSNSAWCVLKSKSVVLKLYDHFNNPKCKCPKQFTLTPRQFQLEGGSIKNKLKSIFRGTQAAWNKFLKPAINATASFIGKAVSAKTKNPKFGQASMNILKSISGGKILSLTGLHDNGLRLKVM